VLAEGANVDAGDLIGRTALMWAVEEGCEEVVSHVMLSYRQVSFFDVTDCNAFTMARLFALLPTWCCLLVLSLLDWLKGAIMASLSLTHIIRVKFEMVDVLAKLGARSFSVRR
jgi:hypothetical protein